MLRVHSLDAVTINVPEWFQEEEFQLFMTEQSGQPLCTNMVDFFIAYDANADRADFTTSLPLFLDLPEKYQLQLLEVISRTFSGAVRLTNLPEEN